MALHMCKMGTQVPRMTPNQDSSVCVSRAIEMLPSEPFTKREVLKQGKSGFQQPEELNYHIWTDLRLAHHPSLKFPEPLKFHPKPWKEESNLSPVSGLLAGGPHNKTSSFLRNQCHGIGFYAHRAVSLCSVTYLQSFHLLHGMQLISLRLPWSQGSVSRNLYDREHFTKSWERGIFGRETFDK